MQPIIRVENLGKSYLVSHLGRTSGYQTLRESLASGVSSLLRRDEGGRTEEFWALKDLTFDISPGEVVGIIGHNGAGKSTFLKIISRITKPTTGRVNLHGRVGSLLEVGTGFHPELTGRENVFLNGAILGMSRREVALKFDEIVAFAEVEKFLDTPVKRYSSGMYVRLAFSVAAHLEPDILVIDEVLAVGDATYQRRCIDRMLALARSGITILLVSHNMDLVPRICDRAILLGGGRMERCGPADEVTHHYLTSQIRADSAGDLSRATRRGNGLARFERVQLVDPEGRPRHAHRCGDDLILEMVVDSRETFDDVDIAVVLQNQSGTRVATSWSRELGRSISFRPGKQSIRCVFRDALLRPGHRIVVGLWMAAPDVLDFVENALAVEIVNGESSRHLSNDKNQGIVVFGSDWETVEAPAVTG